MYMSIRKIKQKISKIYFSMMRKKKRVIFKLKVAKLIGNVFLFVKNNNQ